MSGDSETRTEHAQAEPYASEHGAQQSDRDAAGHGAAGPGPEAGQFGPPARETAPGDAAEARAYWLANLKLTTLLLAAWFTGSYLLGILLVEPLNAFRVGGFPLGFWFAQQGSIYIFILLIVIYALAMDRLARRFGVA